MVLYFLRSHHISTKWNSLRGTPLQSCSKTEDWSCSLLRWAKGLSVENKSRKIGQGQESAESMSFMWPKGTDSVFLYEPRIGIPILWGGEKEIRKRGETSFCFTIFSHMATRTLLHKVNNSWFTHIFPFHMRAILPLYFKKIFLTLLWPIQALMSLAGGKNTFKKKSINITEKCFNRK